MEKDRSGRGGGTWFKPSCIPISIILILIVLVVLLPLIDQHKNAVDQEHVRNFLRTWDRCQNKCRFVLVESIPENLTYAEGSVIQPSIFDGWMNLLTIAKYTVHIASSYWTLRRNQQGGGDGVEHFSSDEQGQRIFNELMAAGTKGNISIKIAQNQPSHYQPNHDTEDLQNKGAADVRSVNFQALLGAGILHTKMWVVDGRHFYLGSANMDWRSLTQVKEVGIIVYNCSCLAEDLERLFEIYWMLGVPGAKIPDKWPAALETDFNATHPALLPLNGTASQVYMGSSPPPMCTKDRTTDIDALLKVISDADKFIYIAVMDYFPVTIYTRNSTFWPVIDDKLRQSAIEKGVKIRLLASHWNHTMPSMPYYLNSLAALNNSYAGIGIEVVGVKKLFVVPSYTKEQAAIPYARVNHNKYMVTDKAVYIGTSNWSGDYFISTGGVSIVVNTTWPPSFLPESAASITAATSSGSDVEIQSEVMALFERDWTSEFARPLAEFIVNS